MHNDSELKQYDRWNVPRPTHDPHGVTPDNVRERMTQLKASSWRLEGNLLIGETDWGPFAQTIPTDYTLESTVPDAQGLPRLVKLKHKK